MFTGRDESLIRACLETLDADRTSPPIERWDRSAHRIEADDRWRAAMLLFLDDARSANRRDLRDYVQAEAAWTVTGARHLAAMLPDERADVRASIYRRFGASDRD